MSYLVPFVPAIAFSTISILPFKSAVKPNKKVYFKKYIFSHSISAMISGGGIFLFSFLIILAGCFVFDPSIAITYYEPLGLFKDVYFTSVPIYILLFVFHSVLFGAIYALFGVGITLTTKSNAIGLVFPGVLYHVIYYIGIIFSQTIISGITIVFPVLPFNFGGLDVPLWKNSIDMGLIIIVSVIMIITGYIKLIKGFTNNHELTERA